MRDEILEASLHSLAQEPVYTENLVFQGGGALHFMYGSPRYSNDLDFVAEDLESHREAFLGSLQKGVVVRGQLVVPRVKEGENFLRAAYSLDEGLPSGKLEIFAQRSFDNAPSRGKFSPLRVESPSEIYADKIVATLARMNGRGSLKGTDLFDLHYIDTNLGRLVDVESLREKAASYGEQEDVNPEMFEEVARHIAEPDNQEAFRAAIGKTLMPDYFEHARFDGDFFKEAAGKFQAYADRLKVS